MSANSPFLILIAALFFESQGSSAGTLCSEQGVKEQNAKLLRKLRNVPKLPLDAKNTCQPKGDNPPWKDDHDSSKKPNLQYRSTKAQLEPGGLALDLKYVFHRAANPSNPPKTIVLFRGGPGGAIGPVFTDPYLKTIPPDYDVIGLEYPGVGENKDIQVKDRDKIYSTAGAAKYAAEVIKKEGLKDYALYGNSFGSTVATRVASELSIQNEIQKPKALYLDSTIGRSFKSDFWETKALQSNKFTIPPETREKLKTKIQQLESRMGGKNKFLDNFIVSSALYPHIWGFDPKRREEGALVYFDWLLKQPNDAILSCLVKQIEDTQTKGSAKNNFESVALCELFKTANPPGEIFFNGLIHADLWGRGEMCRCSNSKVKGTWDSKDHQIRDIPIFYRQGALDDTTTVDMAKYHFDNQTKTSKGFFSDPGGLHGQFFLNKDEMCKDNAWDLMFAGATNQWQSAMDRCMNRNVSRSRPEASR